MLETSYSRIGAQLGVLNGHAPDELAPAQVLSIPASFGRAVVADQVPPKDAAIWEAGFKDAVNDHRYYELTHDALQGQFSHYYLLLKDSSGATRAVQPFFIVKQDIVVGMPDFVTRIVEKVRGRFPSMMKLPVLMVGCSAGEGELAETNGTSDAQWLVRALGEVLPRLAQKLKTELVVFKDFSNAHRPKLDPLKGFGFRRISSMPATKLELTYKSFDHYLETALSAKMRKDLRRKFRRAAAGTPITMEVVRDISPFVDEAFPLYEQVVRKSKLKFEVLTKPYFAALGKKLPNKALFFVWRQEGRMVAFNSCFAHRGVLRDNYVGFDYTVALDYHLYFVSRRDIFSWAIENGYHTYYSGPLNYDPKLHLRQQLAPVDLYVRASRNWLNPLFHRILPLMEPTRYDPIIKRFANAHELA
ncbi:MAG: GNAT family N-acetyltransferase [Methylacidiphilales bacterium]|nr:GNAT family N-acetyltransferase [Candidatus Methylacidiphilales bacterium]